MKRISHRKPNSLFATWWPALLLPMTGLVLLLPILSHGCSLEEPKSAEIRAHTESYSGVEHGFAAAKGARFCKECHGEKLGGGTDGEPSCFQCHGLNWVDRDPDESLAPEDHTTIAGGFHHHPSLKDPKGTCTNCHGLSLQGDKERESPSCYLCHANKWD